MVQSADLQAPENYACVLQNVHKTINGAHILRGVNLSLRKGVVTALLGPNGAGKTSTIRVILGLLTPQHGTVTVFGNDAISNSSWVRKQVGLLPQTDAGYKTLTARENLEFMIKLSGQNVEEMEPQLDELVERLDLTEIIEQDFGTLSGGERRALGFVRALLTGSDFLILDEPTTGLDLARASIMRKIILEQAKLGKTVLMSSHVITDLEELAKDIIIMKDGMVIKSGSRHDIQQYFAPGGDLEDAIVAAFLGDNNQTNEAGVPQHH